MNRIFVFAILILNMVCHQLISLGQNSAIPVPENDIRFNLPASVLQDHSFRLGVDRYNSAKILLDSTVIIDYILKYQLAGEQKAFLFDGSNQLFDRIIPESDKKNAPKAMFNFVFAGITPSESTDPFYFEPNKYLESTDINNYIQDLAFTLNEPLNILNPCATYICLIRLKKKNGEIINQSFYEKYKGIIQLRSRYLLLFWDTLTYRETPILIKNCELVSKQSLCYLTYEDYSSKDEQIERIERIDTIIEDQETPDFQMPVVQFASQALPYITTVTFNGIYPNSLTVPYEIYDVTGRKIFQANQVQARSGIKVYGNLPAKPLMTEYVRLVILKPKGYNIFKASDTGEYNWKENEYSLKIMDTSAISLTIEKIQTFDFFYLDISNLKKRNLAISDVDGKIGAILEGGDSYCIYVSNYEQPLTAKQGSDFSDVLRIASSMNADMPNPNIDKPNILKIVNWPEIIRVNKEIKFHFYISRSTYEIYSKQLIVDLLYKIGNKRWEVFIYSDAALEPIFPANNTYHYINLLKP